MPLPAIGVRLEAIALPFRSALEWAARLGAVGVTLDAVGPFAPAELSRTGQRQVLHLLEKHGLKLLGMGCPTRRGYDHLDRLEGRIQRTLAVLHMAGNLRVPFVTNAIGRIPAPENPVVYAAFLDAMSRIEQEAERVGTRFAVLTGHDAPSDLLQLLVRNNGYGLAVHFQPAHLLVAGHSPYEAPGILGERIVAWTATDVIRTSATLAGFRELPLGQGEIDFHRLAAELEAIDFRGPILIDRETPMTDPAVELANAIGHLRSILG